MAVKKLTPAQFGADVEASHGLVLVDFYAVWCGPCKMLSPVTEEFSEKHPEVPVYKVDIDEAGELTVRFGISAVPTLILFKEGKPFKKSVGLVDLGEIEAMLG